MDYSNKILVAAGCSHTYGQFLTESNPQECHERSWVKKLERLAGFKQSVNLSHPGASNKRSIRVLTDFLLKNVDNIQQYVFMLGTTSLARTEFPVNGIKILGNTDKFINESYSIALVTPAEINQIKDKRLSNFLQMYYGFFSVDAYDIKMINHDMLRFHTLLEHYKVEHYFPVIMGSLTDFKSDIGNQSLPYIRFSRDGNDAFNVTREKGFRMGVDIDTISDCYHFDHDGNEFIAKEIYKSLMLKKGHSNV